MADGSDTGSDFCFEVTIRPDQDPKDAEARWYRWSREGGCWEYYGNEMPSWDELSEGAKDTLARAYGIIFRSSYGRERSEAIERGMNPEELPEDPETMLEVLYHLHKAKERGAGE